MVRRGMRLASLIGTDSGSQASTLVVRAMALDEVRLGDWWRGQRLGALRRDTRRKAAVRSRLYDFLMTGSELFTSS